MEVAKVEPREAEEGKEFCNPQFPAVPGAYFWEPKIKISIGQGALLQEDDERPTEAAGRAKKQLEMSFPCPLCYASYRCLGWLQKHLTSKHHICQPVVQIPCTCCGLVFSDPDQHRRHSEMSNRELAGNLGEAAQLQTLKTDMSRVLKNCVTGAEATDSETEGVWENAFGDNTPGPSAGWVGDEEPEWQ